MSAPNAPLPDHLDEPVEGGALPHWSDDAILHACAVYAHAKHEAERWHARCVHTTKILGKRIWREGHPSERQRRIWRYRARVCREYLTQALGEWAPQGPGH